VSEQELGPEGAAGASEPGAGEPGGAGVLLRNVIPPYRLGEVLLRIGEQKLSGRLALSSDMGKRTIYVDRGFPVFSESSLFGERLGAITVRYGLCGREDVAESLAHSRASGRGLGQSLLELGYLDSARLFALLGVQLREGVAAACASPPQRARFQSDSEALRDLIILRLHPLTAVLCAVAGLPSSERAKLLHGVGARRVSELPLSPLAREWLVDLGYLGELDKLCEGGPTIDTVKSRLLARHRPGAERCFDAQDIVFSLPGARATTERATPGQATDLVMLCLLLSGSIKLMTTASNPPPPDDEPLLNTAESVQRALDRAIEHPVAAARPGLVPPSANAIDQAIDAYLHGKRDRELAAAAAVWGPSVEAADRDMPDELMQLYLALKAEKRPGIVLDVSATAAPEQVMHAYARRTALVSSLTQPHATSAHVQCRAAELTQCFDDALQKLLPGAEPRPLGTPRASMRPSETTSTSAGGTMSPKTPVPGTEAAPTVEAMAAKIDALIRASNWQGVLDTLDAGAASTDEASLPFTLRIARAMAQRELRARHTRSRWRTPAWVLLALACGAAIGVAAQRFAHVSSWLGF
jgi:hypothetical protein